jgi:hypothetical protein
MLRFIADSVTSSLRAGKDDLTSFESLYFKQIFKSVLNQILISHQPQFGYDA